MRKDQKRVISLTGADLLFNVHLLSPDGDVLARIPALQCATSMRRMIINSYCLPTFDQDEKHSLAVSWETVQRGCLEMFSSSMFHQEDG